MAEALAVGVGIVDVDRIEAINIKQAARLAMKQAVEQLSIAPDFLLVDAENVELDIAQSAIIHGDALKSIYCSRIDNCQGYQRSYVCGLG